MEKFLSFCTGVTVMLIGSYVIGNWITIFGYTLWQIIGYCILASLACYAVAAVAWVLMKICQFLDI